MDMIHEIVGSDIHLEYNSYVAHPTLWGDSYHAFDQLVSAAITHDAALLLAGDVFDSMHPDTLTLYRFARQMDRLADNKVACWFIQGNHDFDAKRRKPLMSVHGWPAHAHQATWTNRDGVTFCGLDYQPASHLAAAMAAVSPYVQVLMCHQAWLELMGEHLPSDGSLVELVPDNIRMVITGDFHEHRELHLKNRNGAEFVVLSPGSTSLQSLAEDPAKYYFALGPSLQRESCPLSSRTLLRADLTSETQAEAELARLAEASGLGEKLPEELRRPIWHVRVHSSLAGLVPKLELLAKDRAHLFLRPLDSPRVQDPAVASPFMLNGFEGAIATIENPTTRGLASRLWKSHDVKAEVVAIVADLVRPEEIKGKL